MVALSTFSLKMVFLYYYSKDVRFDHIMDISFVCLTNMAISFHMEDLNHLLASLRIIQLSKVDYIRMMTFFDETTNGQVGWAEMIYMSFYNAPFKFLVGMSGYIVILATLDQNGLFTLHVWTSNYQRQASIYRTLGSLQMLYVYIWMKQIITYLFSILSLGELRKIWLKCLVEIGIHYANMICDFKKRHSTSFKLGRLAKC